MNGPLTTIFTDKNQMNQIRNFIIVNGNKQITSAATTNASI